MRKFNPEKELNKIQKGNKNKIILFVVLLIVVSIVSYSFALYQVRYNKQIIYTTVEPFYNKDMQLAVYVDDSKQDKFPDKSKYYFDKVVCDNNSYYEFDTENWELMLKTNHQDKCNIYFTKNYRDKSGANTPELYQGLIPIYFNEANEMLIADVEKEWYDYDKHNWGNAVLIDNEDEQIRNKFYKEDGTLKANEKITEEDVLQMYVWIPRYKYELFNAVAGETAEEQMINIKFERGTNSTGDIECTYKNLNNGTIEEKCLNKEGKEASNGEWYTHPAFTFGNTELSGIWVGKFEPSEKNNGTSDKVNISNAPITDITILPNKVSTTNRKVSIMFQAVRGIETVNIYNLNSDEIDTHMMKNIEWGAVAYLSQSIYGIFSKTEDGTISCSLDNNETIQTCRVWINNNTHGNYDGTITGCSGTQADDAEKVYQNSCNGGITWNNGGAKSSTTGNLYGIYDMAGGMWEFLMGNMVDTNGNFYDSSAGFVEIPDETQVGYPDPKYYDSYEYGSSETIHYRGHLGDATRETLKTYGIDGGAWDSGTARFPYGTSSWFSHSSSAREGSHAGIFAFSRSTGGALSHTSFRVVLTQQDGEE